LFAAVLTASLHSTGECVRVNSQEANQSVQLPSKRHLLEDFVLLVLIIFTMIGIYISNIAAADIDGYLYWMVMIFVFAISAMLISIAQSKQRGSVIKQILVEQSLHWLGAILALFGVLLIVHAGSLTHYSAGLMFLLILSLATYLDGIRIGWRFGLIGNYLGLAAVVMAYADHSMWILYFTGVLIIAVVFFVDRKRKGIAKA
jgi:cation transport ATPase